jgi:hypothetical protein
LESDPALRQFKQRQERFHQRLNEIRQESDAVLAALEERPPTVTDAAHLERLRDKREKLFTDYLEQTASFSQYLRQVQATNRRTKMVEKRSAPPRRSQAKIEELSQELTTKLRLERVDEAIKELLDFLADPDFFPPNATSGRKRKLRTLQNAIDQALAQ